MFKDNKAIVGTHIYNIENHDEVTNHFLQVFIAHCVRKKGVLKDKDIVKTEDQAQTGTQSAEAIKEMIKSKMA